MKRRTFIGATVAALAAVCGVRAKAGDELPSGTAVEYISPHTGAEFCHVHLSSALVAVHARKVQWMRKSLWRWTVVMVSGERRELLMHDSWDAIEQIRSGLHSLGMKFIATPKSAYFTEVTTEQASRWLAPQGECWSVEDEGDLV